MKHILAIAFITLLALGIGCAWISPSSQTTSDGIQVHGHWTVTVSNPDGSVDAVHEFDNALLNTGLLTVLLAGLNTIDKHVIRIQSDNGAGRFECEEQYFSFNNGFFKHIEADLVIEESSNLPFTMSTFCTVTSVIDDGVGVIKRISTHFADIDKCLKEWTDSEGFHCSVDGAYMDSEWGGTVGGMVVLTEKKDLLIGGIKAGQKLAINVEISFE